MIIEETFYTISKSELYSLCKLMIALPNAKDDFLINIHSRLESLLKDQRISELKFKVQVNNE